MFKQGPYFTGVEKFRHDTVDRTQEKMSYKDYYQDFHKNDYIKNINSGYLGQNEG